jgi:hypothetical protein
METRSLALSVVGYLAGIALGTACLTLVFLGMRTVMDVGGACADGGPYVSAQPCPEGSALALFGGVFGLFAAAGLIIWFGSRLGGGYVSIVFLGWPALFISLGFNFIQYGINPPAADPSRLEWGWLIPGVLFWAMGGIPLLIGIWGWRAARSGRYAPGSITLNRLRASATIPSRRIEFRDDALVSELERLSALRASGALSEEEFAAAKSRILADGGSRL